MFKNPYVKNVLSALAVAFFGFILLNLTFIFDWLIQSFIDLFFPYDFNMTRQWYPPIKHIIFMFIIAVISWFVFKSKLSEIYKAIYLVVPLAVIFTTTWIFLYRWPILAHGISAIIFGGIIFYFYRTKKNWLYYYALILIASVLLVMGLLGVDI
ncbi:hypothetical protein CPJCM30710_26600 [Clostridium polyendosporum]|uniref:Uncharacterized protein n=1 Tax=Clostridium polyendosporum TaxID=69208 RepID=A0A919S184_9CLOT|nr:hypothetical protein [Clostridium polyendosporum]GIM29994.1 hypothetical protein CPJCM30710_26600 [Clostridium polyendosporum]